MISFIIPYQHAPERDTLLKYCLSSFPPSNSNMEICIHETGPEPVLRSSEILKKEYKYLFTQWNYSFHRAWSLNRGVKYLSTGDIIILLDGDLILTKKWFNTIMQCNSLAFGWNYLYYLTKSDTRHYFSTHDIQHTGTTVTPSILGMAGGATVIPRNIFYEVKGFSENFLSWGCEDNAFMLKLSKLNYPIQIAPCQLYHMYHDHTISGKNSKQILNPLINISISEWKDHVSSIINWGDDPETVPLFKPPSHKHPKNYNKKV